MERTFKHERPPKVDKLAQLKGSIASITSRLQSREDRTLSSSEVAVAAKVESRAKKLTRLAGFAGLGLLAAGGLNEVRNYHATRYEITEVKKTDGSSEFHHEDQRTNEIMQFLTGAAELPAKDRPLFYRQLVREAYVTVNWLNGSPPELSQIDAFDQALPDDEAALRAQLIDLYKKQDALMRMATEKSTKTDADYEKQADESIDEITSPPVEYNAQFATGLWKLQQKVGAPRIRWAGRGDTLTADIAAKFIGHGRAFYREADNTIYIVPGEVGETLIAENAHAYQFHKNPVTARMQFALDKAHSWASAFKKGADMYEAQLTEYDRPGSIEHEAHKVIEPRLLEETVRDMEGKP